MHYIHFIYKYLNKKKAKHLGKALLIMYSQ